jgi:hypothetical protein
VGEKEKGIRKIWKKGKKEKKEKRGIEKELTNRS